MVVTDSPKTKEALLGSTCWVDVRDVALGHVLALEKEAAGGERIINTAGTSLLLLNSEFSIYHGTFLGGYIWQEWRASGQ